MVLDRITLKKLAAEAAVDERTLKKKIAGLKVRGMAGDRADRVLREHGIEVPHGR